MRNVVLASAVLLGGCINSTSVNFYPVRGPLAAQRPPPVVVAKVDGILGNTGNVYMELPGGEMCTGRWSSVAPTHVTSGTLFMTYGTTVGFTASGIQPGVNKGQAFATCSGGTTVEAEFYTGSGTANGYGVAKDSKSNVYKMVF